LSQFVRFFFQAKPFLSRSVDGNPPDIGETGMKENTQEMLIGTSTRQELYETIAQQGGDGNSEEEESSADEEPGFEEEICAEQEPIPQAPQGTPLVPVPETTTQCRPNPNQQPKDKKKKPKSFQEFAQDMREQNRELLEKKLDLQLAHQEFLQFLREQSQKQFSLESRRLDLELMRMEQQREDSRIRELALQVELEKLRGNS